MGEALSDRPSYNVSQAIFEASLATGSHLADNCTEMMVTFIR
jgi:hypothetical protein